MLDFDTPLNVKTQPQTETASPEPVLVSDTVVTTEHVRVITHGAAGYSAKAFEMWNWSDLRDYINAEVERRHGPQVRDPKKESGIIKGFINRWGITKAVAIATAAFEVHDGMWRSSPITMTRFCKASDPYFSEIIAKNID